MVRIRLLTHVNRELEDRTDFKLDWGIVDEEIGDPEKNEYKQQVETDVTLTCMSPPRPSLPERTCGSHTVIFACSC